MRALFVIVVLVGLVWSYLKQNVNRIKATPPLFPSRNLNSDPHGETVFIDRKKGGRIRAKVAGNGPIVILAHGYGGTLKMWNVAMDMLVEHGYRVIAFDLMGHGQSTIGRDGLGVEQMALNYKLVLEHFDVQNGVLVGHSTGGFLAIGMLLGFPETAVRLNGLILFASTAGDVSNGAPQNKVQIPLIKSGLMTAIAKTELLGYPFGASLMGPNPTSAPIEAFLDDFSVIEHERLIPILRALDETSFYDRLGEIKIPTMVICGEEDQTTPRWHSEKMGSEIPNAKNIWVSGAGHALNWEAPHVLIDAIAEFHGRREKKDREISEQ